MIDCEIVSRLVRLRVKARLTQADLAEIMGVSRPTVARFEADTRRLQGPSLFVLQRYCAALNHKLTIEAA